MPDEDCLVEEHVNPNVRGLPRSATIAINVLSNKLRGQGREIFKLGLGQSPFPVPTPVVEALRQNASQKDYLGRAVDTWVIRSWRPSSCRWNTTST